MAPTSKAFVTVLLLSLALCQITAAEPSLEKDDLAEKIVKGIRKIRKASDHLRKETKTINETTAAVSGILIPSGFYDIATKFIDVTVDIKSAPNNSLSDRGANLVVEKLTKLVKKHWKPLIHEVQGKHDIHNLSKFFGPIRRSLRTLEKEVKSFEKALLKVNFNESLKTAAEKQFDTLKDTINATITIYKKKIPPTPHGDSPVEAIQEALTTFLQAQQALLNFLIGNRGITTYAGDLARTHPSVAGDVGGVGGYVPVPLV